mgnify:CR=1 FL=1
MSSIVSFSEAKDFVIHIPNVFYIMLAVGFFAQMVDGAVGLGYGERALLHSFTTHSYENYDSTREVWCRNIDSSYKGGAAEVDLMMKITNSVFISVGCNTVNFKYLDLNAGLGVFF